MSRIWAAHTVVAKSPQTLPDVGIQRIGSQPGLFLDASSSSRSKADTWLPACVWGSESVMFGVLAEPGHVAYRAIWVGIEHSVTQGVTQGAKSRPRLAELKSALCT